MACYLIISLYACYIISRIVNIVTEMCIKRTRVCNHFDVCDLLLQREQYTYAVDSLLGEWSTAMSVLRTSK